MSLINDTYFMIYQKLDCLTKFNFRLTCKKYQNLNGNIVVIQILTTNKKRITFGIFCLKCNFTYLFSNYENLTCILAKKFDKLIFSSFLINKYQNFLYFQFKNKNN